MRFFRLISSFAFVLWTSHIDAATVQLSFTGTYDTRGNVVFGQQGSAVAYSYSITYDTSLNTSAWRFDAGDAIGSETASSSFYGYSKSGIVASSLSFGTKSWSAADLAERTIAVGVGADIWFDADIAISTPAKAWMLFSSAAGDLLLGSGSSTSAGLAMEATSVVNSFANGTYAEGRGSMDIGTPDGTVPEPSSIALVAAGLLAACVRRAARPLASC